MSLLQKNRPFFVFLLKFGISYLLLSALYWFYLQQFDAETFEPDGITYVVAKQAKDLAVMLGEDATIERHDKEASYRFLVNGNRAARVVEGCNAVSVMILFAAFVTAFSSTFKRTFLFIIAGLAVIYFLNIVRVALLSLGYYYYPEYRGLLHDIVFPLFIYGVVFLLWILWVQKFSGNAKHTKDN